MAQNGGKFGKCEQASTVLHKKTDDHDTGIQYEPGRNYMFLLPENKLKHHTHRPIINQYALCDCTVSKLRPHIELSFIPIRNN